MTSAGPKSAFSKLATAEGCASHTKRMSADTLSKQYWLKRGFEGFLLISPRMLTRRVRIASYEGTSSWRAVMMTRIAHFIR